MSLPVRERGLKQFMLALMPTEAVAPRAGAWIETSWDIFSQNNILGRSPCGSVD